MAGKAILIAEIDAHELAVRLIERGCHMKRPAGKLGSEAFAEFRAAANAGAVPAYIVDDFEAMALIAIEYFAECADKLAKPN